MSHLGPKTKNLDPVINYISNGRAYDSTIGWATYADAAGAQPVDGTGGSPNVTWSRDTTTPLRQGADFNFVKDAANRQGQGVSYDFTIDNADLAKVLTVTFDYEVLSGTYATGDLTVYLIQDPSGTPTVVQPAGYQIQSATVGTKMRQIATFQTASNVTSYRLCLHVASVSASAYSLAVDNVVLGPQVVQYGAPVTDWQDFPSVAAGTLLTATTTSPTYGTVAYNRAQWRRVGSDMEIRWDYRQTAAGTAGSGTYLFNLPAGYQIDTSKVAPSTSFDDSKSLGVFDYFDLGGAAVGIGWCTAYSATQLMFVMQAQSGSSSFGRISSTYGQLTNASVQYSLKAKVPILGWSSSVQMSNDTDTRVVAAAAFGNANLAVTSGAAIPYTSAIYDTHSSITIASGRFTAPVSGFYTVGLAAFARQTATGNTIFVYKNGSIFQAIVSFGVAGVNYSGTCTLYLNAQEYIDLRADGGFTLLQGFTTFINRLSGPSAIAASETVAAKYYVSVTNTPGANLPINFDTRIKDTHGSVTVGAGWRFTAPVSGAYNVSTHTYQDSATNFQIRLFKNGSAHENLYYSGTGGAAFSGSTLIDLLAGEYIDIRPDAAGGIRGSAGVPYLSAVSIHRIGN